MSPRVERIVVMTHEGVRGVETPVRELRTAALEHGMELCVDAASESAERLAGIGVETLPDAARDTSVSLCITFGGDGTILRALREFAGTGVPVFAINFGQVGFLATAEPEDLRSVFETALTGRFDRLAVPAVTVRCSDGDAEPLMAINDISIHRSAGGRVAELGYGVAGHVIGNVRCDGLVACTPAGSTGYNLANGGPILAWGVSGYGVSFIAPHSLTARAIVVSPDDELVVENRGQDTLEVSLDGRASALRVSPGGQAILGYRPETAVLAQLPDESFYARLRDKFGHLRG